MRLLKLIPDNTNIGFVKLRGWAFGLTAFLTVLAVGSWAMFGLHLGVDFVGGIMIEAKFEKPPETDKLRKAINNLELGDVNPVSFGDKRIVSIQLPPPDTTDQGATNREVKRVQDTIRAIYPDVTFTRAESVSGKVSGELIRNGILAVVLAVFAIAIFGGLRFEWQFGVSTFVAIAHDVLMTLGFFAITQLEFDLTIVAAILTIVSYSINDKIVIDDRIRENMRKYRQMDMRSIVDLSVNETLPRTVMTSVTILLALAALLLFGGHVLRGLTCAMILGVVVGTYSSIYVSSSLLITLGLEPQPFAGPKVKGFADAERP